jgi:hypothetical protein
MLNAMDQKLTALERAFQLAKSGRVKDLEEIRMLLAAARANVVHTPAIVSKEPSLNSLIARQPEEQ